MKILGWLMCVGVSVLWSSFKTITLLHKIGEERHFEDVSPISVFLSMPEEEQTSMLVAVCLELFWTLCKVMSTFVVLRYIFSWFTGRNIDKTKSLAKETKVKPENESHVLLQDKATEDQKDMKESTESPTPLSNTVSELHFYEEEVRKNDKLAESILKAEEAEEMQRRAEEERQQEEKKRIEEETTRVRREQELLEEKNRMEQMNLALEKERLEKESKQQRVLEEERIKQKSLEDALRVKQEEDEKLLQEQQKQVSKEEQSKRKENEGQEQQQDSNTEQLELQKQSVTVLEPSIQEDTTTTELSSENDLISARLANHQRDTDTLLVDQRSKVGQKRKAKSRVAVKELLQDVVESESSFQVPEDSKFVELASKDTVPSDTINNLQETAPTKTLPTGAIPVQQTTNTSATQESVTPKKKPVGGVGIMPGLVMADVMAQRNKLKK